MYDCTTVFRTCEFQRENGLLFEGADKIAKLFTQNDWNAPKATLSGVGEVENNTTSR